MAGQVGVVPVDPTAGAVTDRFSPRYLVGNVAAGDPALGQVAPFRYIGDPGDGTGIATAIAEATVIGGAGDITIRRGLYTKLVGSIPYVVPPGITVRGSGQTTTIAAPATGDQGVFTLGVGSTLKDLAISVPAFGGAAPSSAAVLCTSASVGTTFVRDVSISLSTALGGTMRNGVAVSGPLGYVAQVESVAVTATPTTDTPTSCLRLVSGLMVGSNLITTGGNHGIRAGGTAIVSAVNVERFTAIGWLTSGVLSTGDVRVRVMDGRISPAFAAVAPIGIHVTGGTSHLMRACSLEGFDIAAAIAMRFVSCSDVDVDDCESNNFATVLRGEGITRMSVRSTTGTDVRSFGIELVNAPATSVDCHFRGCHFELNKPGGAVTTPVGISVEGTRHEIEGNRITTGIGIDPASNAIRIVSAAPATSSIVVRGNNIRQVGGSAIVSGGARTVIADNIIEQATGSPAGTPAIDLPVSASDGRCTVGNNSIRALAGAPGIRVATDFNTITGNTITNTGAPPSPGIVLLAGADANTCTANVCEGAGAAAPVSNLGALNEVSHNIGTP